MRDHIIDERLMEVGHPIRPQHIDVSVHFWDAFGNHEAEVAAKRLVRFFQTECVWVSFTQKQLEDFYREIAWRLQSSAGFTRLTEGKFVVEDDEGHYRVTHLFITRCFMAAPKLIGIRLPQSAVA